MGAENERLWREHCERCDRTKDGGQAFPVTDMNGGPASGGMSLRDYFAAAVLQGLCASLGPCLDDAFVSGVARRAYDIADAMIAARERKEG
jgi:hypothetical protein